MPRRTKAATPGVPATPVEIAAEAPVAPAKTPTPPPPVAVETPSPSAPMAEQDTRSPLAVATGTDNTALQGSLLRDLVAVLGLKPGTAAFEQRGAAAVALMSSFEPRNAVEGMLAQQIAALNASGMAALARAATPDLPREVASRLRRDAASLFRAVNETVEAIEARRGNGPRQRIVVERVDKAIFTGPQGGGS